MYDTVEEARQKLENSTVLFEGQPVHVLQVSGKKNQVTLGYYPLPFSRGDCEGPKDFVSISDKRWDFKSLGTKLGYINVEKSPWHKGHEAVFASRVPTRNSRQGLDTRTVRITQFYPENNWEWTHILGVEGLNRTVNNIFPTAPEAVTMLYESPDHFRSVAIGRKLMMIFDKINPPNLVYRNEKVGYTENGKEFKLAPHKSFLAEELTDMFNLRIA